MAKPKGGRGWGKAQSETEQGRLLTEFLRSLLDNAGKKLADLEGPTKYSKTSIGDFVSGKQLPAWQFVEDTVRALSPIREREPNMRKAERLWKAAKYPPEPAHPVPAQRPSPPEEGGEAAPGAQALAGLASVAATAQDQAAQAQRQLADAHERNHQLTEERDQYQQMVVALSGLTVDLQRQVDQVTGIPDPDAEEELASLTEQLGQARSELERARMGRDEAEALAHHLRQRSHQLEEQIALLRRSEAAAPATAPRLNGLPADLREAFFETDVERMLRTAQSFLDEGQANRDQTRDDWDLHQPGRPAIDPAERWRISSRLLARTLGCLTALTATVAHQFASQAKAGLWTAPLTLLALAGLLLTCDPAGVAVRLWPVLRGLLLGQPLGRPVPISAQDLARRLLRGTVATLAAGLSLLAVLAATRGSGWWLLPLIPSVALCAGYAIVGRDQEVVVLLEEAVGRLAADLQTPRPEHGWVVPRRLPVVLADPQWIAARRDELGAAFAGGLKQAALWIKVAAVCLIGLFALALGDSILSALPTSPPLPLHHADFDALAATVDNPMRAYLAAHTGGLPLSPATIRHAWLVAGGILLALSWMTGTFGARITWTFWGAASTAMVWSGTPGPARQVATALALLWWGLASVLAFQGFGVRRAPSQHHNITVRTGERS